MTTAWADLVSAALVGTERRPAPETGVAAAEAVAGGPLRAATEEQTVLAAAAALGAHRRAGVVTPGAAASAPAPAPDDPRPDASTGASRLLELVLGGHVAVAGGSTPVAVEWLARCAATGHRLPARLLPAVLDRATVVRELRPPAVAAGGERLRWLATRNPAWAWAVDAPGAASADRRAWETGEGDRFAVLAAVRATEPDAARAMVEATWKGEKAADRARIVEVLRTNLDVDDEPFLEAALDDRAGSVRAAAAEALAALPGSRLAARMAVRLEPLVRTSGRLRRKVEADLPDEPDDAARRDGITDGGAPTGIGRRAWWLTQLVASTPLDWWTQHVAPSPQDVVALAHQPELRRGLVSAAVRQRDEGWAAALFADEPEASLLAVLPRRTADALLSPALRTAKEAAAPSLLAAVPGPWSPALSAAAVATLRAAKNGVVVEHGLGPVATRADPSVVDDVERWIADLGGDDRRRRLVREAAHALTIRRTITEELR